MGFENFDTGSEGQDKETIKAIVAQIKDTLSKTTDLDLQLADMDTSPDAELEDSPFEAAYQKQQKEIKDILGAQILTPEQASDLAYELIVSDQMLAIDDFVLVDEDGHEQEMLLDLDLAERLERDGYIVELKNNAMKFDPEAQEFIDRLSITD